MSTLADLSPEVAQPLLDNAHQSFHGGDVLWGCYVVIATFEAPPLKQLTERRWSPVRFIGAVEGIGWHLDTVDHVFIPSGATTIEAHGRFNQGMAGRLEAHYLFRRRS